MFAAATLAILVTLALAIIRAILGPTVFDRAQAGNTTGTMAVLLLAVIGFLNGRPEFLDLAIVYGLLNLVGTIAVLKFFRYGDLGDPGEAEPAEADVSAAGPSQGARPLVRGGAKPRQRHARSRGARPSSGGGASRVSGKPGRTPVERRRAVPRRSPPPPGGGARSRVSGKPGGGPR